MEEARIEFEKEREQILSALPESIKEMFGQIGFTLTDPPDDDEVEGEAEEPAENDYDKDNLSKWMIPVLIVSPYDVPPKPVRDVYWFDLFSKGKRSKRLDNLAYLVYHYGSNDPGDCYSFIEHDEFISYDIGIQNGYDVIPNKIIYKMKNHISLTEEEEILVRGLQEIKEDAMKLPQDRKRGIPFQERHEQIKVQQPAVAATKKAPPSSSSSKKATAENNNKNNKKPLPPAKKARITKA